MTYPNGSGEYKDLLDSNGDPSLENAEFHQEPKPLSVKKVKLFSLFNPWILHLAMVILYSTLFILIAWMQHAQHFHGPGLIFSPARDAVEYEKVTFNGSFIIDSPFTGVRRPEQDKAWHDLLQNSNIRVSEDTLKKIGHDSIPFADGNGYYAELSMFHELHCLKRIRNFINKAHSSPNNTDKASHIDWQHTDHCLEILRQGAVCRGDISLVTFYWDPSTLLPLADFTRPHECVNFERLNHWSGEHAVNALEPGLLHHPVLGDSFSAKENTMH